MNRRTWKTVALVAAGGMVCQLTGCVGTLVAIAGQNIVSSVLRGIIDAVLGGLGLSDTTA